jgi:hypothetical protein
MTPFFPMLYKHKTDGQVLFIPPNENWQIAIFKQSANIEEEHPDLHSFYLAGYRDEEGNDPK